MKRKFYHPETTHSSHHIWKGEDSYQKNARFKASLTREFDGNSTQELFSAEEEEKEEKTRRDFLKIMGAASALAGVGLASCRRAEVGVVSFAQSPEWTIPGKALYYTTAMPTADGSIPLLGKLFDGNPSSMMPNKIYPEKVSSHSFVYASVLNLYSSNRSRNFVKNKVNISFSEGLKQLTELTKELAKNKRFAVVVGEDASPTRSRLLADLQSKYNVDVYSYEALTGEGRKLSNQANFGQDQHAYIQTNIDFSKANRILALDCDFLELESRGNVLPFFQKRRPEGAAYEKKPNAADLNRLYVMEGRYSITGGMADHRKRVKPSEIALAVRGIWAILTGAVLPQSITPDMAKWLSVCVKDLQQNRGNSVVVVGDRYSREIHDMVFAINQNLGAITDNEQGVVNAVKLPQVRNYKALTEAKTFDYDYVIWLSPGNLSYENAALAKKVFSANTRLVHLGENSNLTAKQAYLHIPKTNYLEQWGDGFTAEGRYTVTQPLIAPIYQVLSELELLTSLNNQGKVNSCAQSGISKQESSALQQVKATYRQLYFNGKDDSTSSNGWIELLGLGFNKASTVAQQKNVLSPVSINTAMALSLLDKQVVNATKKTGVELVFVADYSVWDGRYIENSWLQEAPDPISKLTWDNAALIAPKTARDLGVFNEQEDIGLDNKYGKPTVNGEGLGRTGRVISITVQGKTLEIPVTIAYGQAEGIIVLPVGYGQGYNKYWREEFVAKGLLFNSQGETPDFYQNRDNWQQDCVGEVGVNRGFNAYHLQQNKTYFTTGAKVEITKKLYKLAVTQEHNTMHGRALAREVSTMPATSNYYSYDREGKPKKHSNPVPFEEQLKYVGKQGAVDSHAPQNIPIYGPEGSQLWHDKEQALGMMSNKLHQWAMTIDLSSCTGCNACLIACQAENNIPVVGKEQVARGREMHWIRMDRYFAIESHSEAAEKADLKHLDSDDIAMIPQPVACVQCESAPCETVCPVNATVHTDSGLNSMAYNRCIGTRYCANNCPYKARRFNYFDYNKRNPLLYKNLYKGPLGKTNTGALSHLQKNPNVTIRMRGVMEKCTYCNQRIQEAIIEAKQKQKRKVQEQGKQSANVKVSEEEIRVSTGSISTACQDACPAGSIVFGNLLDKNDPIRRLKTADNMLGVSNDDSASEKKLVDRTYDLLNYIGTRPRTSYLARVKNPNQKMPNAKNIGRTTINMH